MSNRITEAIAATERGIAESTAKPATLDRLHSEMDIDEMEYVCYQDQKSLAQASGSLTYDEAVTVYDALGSGPAAFNSQPLAVKVVVAKLMSELLGARLSA